MPVDISDALQHIPEKYFKGNQNYEDDPKTLVTQM